MEGGKEELKKMNSCKEYQGSVTRTPCRSLVHAVLRRQVGLPLYLTYEFSLVVFTVLSLS